ncbi:MAG: HAD-IIB family hydrolase [Lachnospiraceae bacterium]|nr:HAD-IIB family hydrolase [Lachnospiraceae bacterium]
MNLIFLDIDMTIWDERLYIPESTKDAIKLAKVMGNKVFINTGRSRSNTRYAALDELGMDGVVAACGCHIEIEGEVLYQKLLTCEQIRKSLNVLRSEHMPVVLEGSDNCFFDPEDFPDDPFAATLWESLGERARRLDTLTESDPINKFSADITKDTDFDTVCDSLGGFLDTINHNGVVVEFVPKGHSKATGMELVRKHYDVPFENVYAVGDGMNDMEMIKSAAHGIAMGQGNPELLMAAEYVTDSVYEDGIYRAFKHYKLI